MKDLYIRMLLYLAAGLSAGVLLALRDEGNVDWRIRLKVMTGAWECFRES